MIASLMHLRSLSYLLEIVIIDSLFACFVIECWINVMEIVQY